MSGFSFSNPAIRAAWFSGPHSFTHHWSHFISVAASTPWGQDRPRTARVTRPATAMIVRRRIGVLPLAGQALPGLTRRSTPAGRAAGTPPVGHDWPADPTRAVL